MTIFTRAQKDAASRAIAAQRLMQSPQVMALAADWAALLSVCDHIVAEGQSRHCEELREAMGRAGL